VLTNTNKTTNKTAPPFTWLTADSVFYKLEQLTAAFCWKVFFQVRVIFAVAVMREWRYVLFSAREEKRVFLYFWNSFLFL